MGHGKETPRQKMIGMMYLVLTALLALNVAKEVLEGFEIVEKNLTKTIENFTAKNEKIYADFQEAYLENPVKVEKWKNIADQVREKADALYEKIEEYKLKIVRTADGPEGTLDDIKGQDNLDVAAQVMLVEAKRGKELKDAINEFKDFMLSHVKENAIGVRKSIQKGLDTSDPPPEEGITPSWESHNFEHMPLMGVITLMSAMQSDVRNAESDMITYLFSQIEASSFKFNKLEATVIAKSNYILSGGEYEAEVFLAAFDTTQDPVILVGPHDSTENGWEMTGSFDTLDISNSRGYFSKRATSIGEHTWGGLIKYTTPDGTVNSYPFKSEYRVAERGGLVVSPTKMNVFYKGVDNPVEISVPGFTSDKIFPSMTNGTITKSRKGGYIVRPNVPGKEAQVSVSVEIEGKRKPMGSVPFRVKSVPDPIPKVADRKGGLIRQNVLLTPGIGVIAELENFDFDLKFRVTEFTISTTIRGYVQDRKAKGSRITQDQRKLLEATRRGSKVYFEDIVAVGPDGIPRRLPTISFKLQ